MNHFLSVLSFMGMCFGSGENPYNLPVVRTDSGMISGKFLKIGYRDVTAFLGIPFAEPPIGDSRFQKPQPVKKWSNVLEATHKPPACMQYSSRNISWYATSIPDENCLFLNIWVPGKCFDGFSRSPSKLKVLVWIYGGGFAAGSTDMDIYDGAILSSTGNTIVVTINYRVGIFGFLNAFNKQAPGNMGMHDQNMAMRWVKENIKYFGGDENSITLAGESAGAVSVGLHMLSPMSKGLFNKAIMQSAAPYHPALIESQPTALFKANFIAGVVGCSDDKDNFFTDPEKMVECLKKKDAFQIAKAEDLVTQKLPYFFLPSSGDDFMPVNPIKAMNAKQFSDVDLLIGNMKDEGTLFLNYLMPEFFNLSSEPQLNLAAAQQMIQGIFMNSTTPSPNVVSDFYLKNLSDDKPKEIIDAVANSYGDFIFACPSLFFAEKVSEVYYYEITHRREVTTEAEWTGAPHFSDVPFLFGIPIFDTKNYTDRECKFSQNIIHKWMSFARYGNPLSLRITEKWPKFDSTSALTRELNINTYDIKKHPRWDACNFWRPYFADPSS